MYLIKKYYSEITGLIVFVIYMFTIAPSVLQIDTGELSAVQFTLGIAHPTGYPLFTLVGYIFLQLPLPFTKIFQANLLASIWCAAAIIFFARSSMLILDNIYLSKKLGKTKKNTKVKKQKEKAITPDKQIEVYDSWTKIIAVIAGALVLAFSKTFWFQSTSVEVYSLHLFLLNLIIYFSLKAYYSNENLKYWLLLAGCTALGFSNHMTTLLILPGIAFLFYSKEKFTKRTIQKNGYMAGLFAVVLALFYSYLPIRASQNPLINWGNPVDLERFMRHFTGKQYQVWLFSSFDAAKKQLTYFFDNLPNEFSFIVLMIAFIGLFLTYKRSRKVFFFIIISFVFTVLYSINYDIVDIDSYFLLAYISLALFAVFGLAAVIKFMTDRKIKLVFACLIIALPISFQLYINFNEIDQSGIYTYEDYTKELLGSVEENSVIFSYQWDYFLSASYYFQFVENYRRDVAVIDKELLRRSWYYDQISNAYPGITDKLKPEIGAFLKALKPFERSENFDANLLERLYQQIMTKLVSKNINKRGYYIGPELVENEIRQDQFRLPDGYMIVPHLFLYKVVKGNDYVPAPEPKFKIQFPQKKNRYIKFIERMIVTMLSNRALYEMQYNKIDKARQYVKKIVNEFPSSTILPQLKALLKK